MKLIGKNFIVGSVKEARKLGWTSAVPSDTLYMWSDIITSKEKVFAPLVQVYMKKQKDSTHSVGRYFFTITPRPIKNVNTLPPYFSKEITDDGKHYYPFVSFMKKHGLEVVTL